MKKFLLLDLLKHWLLLSYRFIAPLLRCTVAILFCCAIVLLLCCSVAMAAPFVDNGNGTVSDNKTGLIWQQGEPGYMNWQAALDYCNGLELANKTNWRLPNVKELESLTDDSRYNPAIDRNFFPNANASFYWSSTTFASFPDDAWSVNFGDGFGYGYGKNDSSGYGFYVRCVRGGQYGVFDNLSGKVLDATIGSPLPGITVTVDGTFTDISDSGGNYSFTGLSKSSHTATVNVTGFVYYSRSVCGTTLDILLTKNSAVYGSQTNSG